MKSQLEQELRQQLQQEVPIPEAVQKKANQAYLQIKNGQVSQETSAPTPRLWIKRTAAAFGSVAAALFLGFLLCLSNPVMAEDLPLVGNLFSRLQDQVSFFGDFQSHSVPLDSTEEDAGFQQSDSQPSAYSKTANGLTVTLSEVYTDPQAVYLTVLMETEDAFPDTMIDQNGQLVLSMNTLETYDFVSPTEEQDEENLTYLEGEFIDDHTYSCILRLDLNNLKTEIPDNFHLDLQIQQIQGQLADPQVWDSGYTEEELSAMSDEQWKEVMNQMPEEYLEFPNSYENYWYDGPWDFSLDLTVDSSRTQTIQIDEIGEHGAGLSSVVLSPYELIVNDLYSDDVSASDFFCVALDANGNKLPYNDSEPSCNAFTIQDRDISTVDIYILDYMEYMDELKGEENYNDNETKPEEEKWSTLLDEHCLYHTTLHLDKIE
ncbi:MAG: DUF4179 domain-containing protein [Blautia sp.]